MFLTPLSHKQNDSFKILHRQNSFSWYPLLRSRNLNPRRRIQRETDHYYCYIITRALNGLPDKLLRALLGIFFAASSIYITLAAHHAPLAITSSLPVIKTRLPLLRQPLPTQVLSLWDSLNLYNPSCASHQMYVLLRAGHWDSSHKWLRQAFLSWFFQRYNSVYDILIVWSLFPF